MRKIFGFLGFIALAFVLMLSAADAAPAQNARGGTDVSRAGFPGSVARPPTIPGVGGINIGGGPGGTNVTTKVPTTGPNACPNCNSNCQNQCCNGCCGCHCNCSTETGCVPGATQACKTPEGKNGTQICKDDKTWGECKIPDQSVDDCMTALLACVNGGGLPGGISDMYDVNLRNSIINGMSLCQSVVDYCIANVKVNGRQIYHSSADVWIAFNSRVVQPQYFSFVLRKTGLTPHQAENTCWLLDTNNFGKSFAAVGDIGSVRGEFHEDIGPYNNNTSSTQGIKTNPLGPELGSNWKDYDAQRGHYARWDATAGECLVRVAAYYNKPGGGKDELITNRWLGIGDDKAAEAWLAAGSSFKCGKELFEFGLMTKTKSVALFGGVATAAGITTGAIIGAVQDSNRKGKEEYCKSDDNRKAMYNLLREDGRLAVLNGFIKGTKIDITRGQLNADECKSVMKLYEVYHKFDGYDFNCTSEGRRNAFNFRVESNGITREQYAHEQAVLAVATQTWSALPSNTQFSEAWKKTLAAAEGVEESIKEEDSTFVSSVRERIANVAAGYVDDKTLLSQCPTFHSIDYLMSSDTTVVCQTKDCVSGADMKAQIDRLGRALSGFSFAEQKNGMSQAAKGALIGGAIGLGAGGLATAITAFVEKNNINCIVGDGLDKVGMGKSGNIDSLKNFYVKWKLNLPETPSPTAKVVDCESWQDACAVIKDIAACTNATVNYQAPGLTTVKNIQGACKVAGSVCQIAMSVAQTEGACE